VVGQRDLQRRDLLAEQARPGRAAGDRLLGEDLLLGLGEQVGPVTARRAQKVARGVDPVGRQQLVGAVVFELFSCMRCINAPICGSAVSTLKRSIA
jgi:hypothetical protein